jgi:putative two-component system response regulator
MIPDESSDKRSILIVEDDPALLIALRDILEGVGYQVRTAQNGELALRLLQDEQPSLILSDITMPVMDGFELFESVRQTPGGMGIPFIFLTARQTREDIFAGKTMGADDYITKPVSSKELIAAVEARLRRADEIMLVQLKEAYKASLQVLAAAIEARDEYTRVHVDRVYAFSRAIAHELEWDDARMEALEFGAILHDIGKIAVRESVLRKPGRLSDEEWDEMRRHPLVGAHMIEGIPFLAPAVPIIRHHHERWDGSGYPYGLKGDQIPEASRLLAIADALDAITSNRPYRAAESPAKAYEIILDQAGSQFDPAMVAAFQACWRRGEIHRILELTHTPEGH